MAVVLLTQNEIHGIDEQFVVAVMMLVVVGIAYALMRCSSGIIRVIGDAGANIVSRVMGMILASVAATEVLQGIKEYFG